MCNFLCNGTQIDGPNFRTRRLAKTRCFFLKASFLIAVIPGLICALAVAPLSSTAQSTSTSWSDPVDLTAMVQDEVGAYTPRVAADAAGNLHVIWNGYSGPDPSEGQPRNVIFYTWWNGTLWSRPVDVISAPQSNDWIESDSIVTTPDGYVLIAWRTVSTMAVSQAPVGKAKDPHEWKTVHFGGGAESGLHPKLAVDPLNLRWYLSVDDQSSINLLYSEDHGKTWSTPKEIASVTSASSAFTNDGLAVASDGSINLVWTENTEQRNWGGGAIWHARIIADDEIASTIREVARKPDTDDSTIAAPILVTGPSGSMHLFWNNGVGSKTGRFHQWSHDNGITWSEIENVFPGLSGQTQQAGLVLDSAGVLHLATSADGFGYSHGVIRSATWEEIPRWSNFIDLWPELYPGEVPALCVTEGNRLHLVWNVLEEKQDGSVYRTVVYSTRTVDAQVVPSHGFISLSFEPSLGEQSSSSQVSAEETRAQTPLPRAIGENFADNPQTVSVSDRNLTILLGVTPAMCFVVVVIGLQLRRRRFRD